MRLANLFCADTLGMSFRKLLLYGETLKRAAKKNATSNGGEASRLGKEQCPYTKKRLTDSSNYSLVCESLL